MKTLRNVEAIQPFLTPEAHSTASRGCTCPLHRALFAVAPIEVQATALASASPASCEAAFEILNRVHGPRVRAACYAIVRNRADAEDLTQEVFLRIFRGVTNLRGVGNFSAWLRQVAVSCALQFLRDREPSPAMALNEMPDEFLAVGGMDEEARLVLRTALDPALTEMPDRAREVFLMHEQGFTHAEIAAQLNIDRGTSKSQLSYARRHLKQALAAWAPRVA